MKQIIVDVESTNGATNFITEIIEFGFTVLADGEIIEKGGFFIKPQYSTLDYFIEELTGITEEDLKYAKDFKSSMVSFFSKHPPEEYIFVSWGDYDKKMMNKMCELWEMEPFKFNKFLNLKKAFKDFYGLTKEKGLAKALIFSGIELEGKHHSGIDDAYNTSKIYLKMISEGWTN